jgi:HD-like signal output (HDOD) protein/GGDEF domain-containing protein
MTLLLTPEELLLQSGELYSLPAVAMELLAMADDPTLQPIALKRCFERDPALTAKVLRVVNSSLFGLAHPVSDLNQAITLLGLKPLKLLVLGFSVPPALTAGVEAEMLRAYWKSTLTKAVIAREVAERLRTGWGDDAFLAGLLADLGLLVLIQRLGEPFLKVIHRVRSAHRDLGEVERHALGFDHVQLTGQLLRRWGLPVMLIEAISSGTCDGGMTSGEHEHDGPGNVRLGQVLRFAEQATRFLCDRQAGLLPQLSAMAAGQFGISGDALNQLFESLEETVKQLAQSLSLDLPDACQYTSILEEANRQLSGMATEMATDLARRRAPQPDAPPDEYALWNEVRMLSRLAAEFCGNTPAETSEPQLAAPTRSAVTPDATARQPVARRSHEPAELDVSHDPVDDTKDADLLKTLGAAVKVCRKARLPLSLVMIEADRREPDKQSAAERAFWIEELGHLCHTLEFPSKICLQVRTGRWALVLLGADRSAAVELAGDLLHQIRGRAAGAVKPVITASLGAATVPVPSPNFAPRKLLEAAGRCLYGAQIAGNTVKSIEIY